MAEPTPRTITGVPVFGDPTQIRLVKKWAEQEAWDELAECPDCFGRGGHGDGYNCETCHGEGKDPAAVREFVKRFPNFL